MHKIKVKDLVRPILIKNSQEVPYILHSSKLRTCSLNCDICKNEIPYIQFSSENNKDMSLLYSVFEEEIIDDLNLEDDVFITRMKNIIKDTELLRIPKGTFIGLDENNKIILR